MKTSPQLPAAAAWLGGTGLIPFLAGAAVAFAATGPLRASAISALLAFGAVILSFLGGIRWGLAMAGPAESLPIALTVSVVPSLLAWAALLTSAAPGCALLATGLLAMLVLDLAAPPPAAPAWFPRLRLPLSIGAAISLLTGAMLA